MPRRTKSKPSCLLHGFLGFIGGYKFLPESLNFCFWVMSDRLLLLEIFRITRINFLGSHQPIVLLLHCFLYLRDWWVFVAFLAIVGYSILLLKPMRHFTCTWGKHPHQGWKDSATFMGFRHVMTVLIWRCINNSSMGKQLLACLNRWSTCWKIIWSLILHPFHIIKLLRRHLALFTSNYFGHFILESHLDLGTTSPWSVRLLQADAIHSTSFLFHSISWNLFLRFRSLSL